jgi:hypothetical protein
MMASDIESMKRNDNDFKNNAECLASTSQTSSNSSSSPKLNDNSHTGSYITATTAQHKPISKKRKSHSNLTALRETLSRTEEKLGVSINQLQAQSATFPSLTLTDTPAERQKAAAAHAQSITDKHIAKLKRYNEIKDIALGLLNLIAEREGRRLADVLGERGLSERD